MKTFLLIILVISILQVIKTAYDYRSTYILKDQLCNYLEEINAVSEKDQNLVNIVYQVILGIWSVFKITILIMLMCMIS